MKVLKHLFFSILFSAISISVTYGQYYIGYNGDAANLCTKGTLFITDNAGNAITLGSGNVVNIDWYKTNNANSIGTGGTVVSSASNNYYVSNGGNSYYYARVYTTSGGYFNTTTIMIPITGSGALYSVVTGPSLIVPGVPVTYTSHVSVVNGGNYSLTWLVGGNSSAASGATSGTNTYTTSNLKDGDHVSVSYTATSCGSGTSNTITIHTISGTYTISPGSDPAYFCSGSVLSIKDDAGRTVVVNSVSISNIAWYKDGSIFKSSSNNTAVTTSGSYSARITFTDGTFINTSSVAITLANPSVVLTGPALVSPNQGITYAAQVSGVGVSSYSGNFQLNGATVAALNSAAANGISTYTASTIADASVMQVSWSGACGTYPSSNSITVHTFAGLWTVGNTVAYSPYFMNIGIGTPTPTQQLEVAGNIKAGSQFLTGKIGIGTITPGAYVDIIDNAIAPGTPYINVGDEAYLTDIDQANTLGIYGTANPDRAGLKLGSSGPVIFGSNNGYAGIGTLTPTQQLEVAGNIKAGSQFLTGNIGIGTITPGAYVDIADNNITPGTPFIKIGDDTYLTDIDQANTLGIYGIANSDRAGLKLGSSGPVIFGLNGNIGIGTTSPSAALEIVGSLKVSGTASFADIIHTKEVRVCADPAGTCPPDYVFEKDYQLMSLAEIEEYISANKHLPEVPSANEILQNGVGMMEMNMILLKKVEEQTLHMIEMAKTIRELEKRLVKVEKVSDK